MSTKRKVAELAAEGLSGREIAGRLGITKKSGACERCGITRWRGAPLNMALHPTQLYEAGAALLILTFLLATERKGRYFPGRTFWSYMFLYAVTRYIIEIYRGDPRGMVMGMSTSQFISLILAPLSIAMLVWLARTGPEPTVEAEKKRRKAAA